MLKIAAIIWIVLGTVLAGIAVMVVLNVPGLFDEGMKFIPVAAAVGFVLAIPFALIIAHRVSRATAGPAGTVG
jgi:hypothetical protein